MAPIGGDHGDDKPRRPSGTKRPIRKTNTGQTVKAGNSARSKYTSRKDYTPMPPRKPIRASTTDQPLMAPPRASAEEDYVIKRQVYGEPHTPLTGDSQFGADEALDKQIKLDMDEVLLAEPTLLHRTDSEDSNLQRREKVMAHTVFDDDSSYAADQRLKASLKREQHDHATLMAAKSASASRGSLYDSDQDIKASLSREQQEQANLMAAKNASTAVRDGTDRFMDEPGDDASSAPPGPLPPPTRQSRSTMVVQPGAYRGNPGEAFRRNASNWKGSFIATRRSSEDEVGLPTYTPPHAGDRMPPPSLHTGTSTSAGPKDELLVQAQPVTDEEAPTDPSELELAKPQKEYQQERQRKRLLWLIGVFLVLLVLLILGLVIGTVVRSQRKEVPPDIVYNSRAPSAPPTSPPTLAPTLPWVEDLPEDTLLSIQSNRTSPQARAYQWIGADPLRSTYSALRTRQRFALASIYFATDGGIWRQANNWLDYQTHECDWFSKSKKVKLNCNTKDEYLHLKLPNNTLGGTIPPEIGMLTALEELDMSANQIQGNLPSQVGLLSNLKSLLVNENYMAGSLPTELGLLTLIEMVHIFDNNFQGSLPTEIGQLTRIREWHMKKTRIGGPIPTEIGNWNSLTSLWTWNTALTGTLPSEIGRMTSLTYLAMHNGALQGTIPTEFGLLSALNYLQLDVQNLTGTIPSELGQLKEATFLSFGSNQLVSTLPTELGLLPHLQGFRFYQNQLTGSLPTELGLLRFLQRLELDDNQFVGAIPSELARVPFLSQLFLANNQLSGRLPPQLGDLAYLEEVTLINNRRLGGSIPPEWDNLAAKSLEELFLVGVDITGVIPSGLCTIDRLTVDCDANVCGCRCQACT